MSRSWSPVVAALAALTVTVAATASAQADQCAWVGPEVAERAAAELTLGRSVVEYCEPCRDRAPGWRLPLRSPTRVVPIKRRGKEHPGFREVIVNGRPVDLAYLFVERRPGEFDNVALLAGCPAHGVSAMLRIPRGPVKGTSRGAVAPLAR